MKKDKMPTALALSLFSWLIAILGFSICAYLVFTGFGNTKPLITAIAILLGSLLLATIVRILGNNVQILFNNSQILYALLEESRTTNKILLEDLKSANKNLYALLDDVNKNLIILKDNNQAILEQISCDSKDINQNIENINVFFERIEKHLDLKK
jgi:hypothetical protein